MCQSQMPMPLREKSTRFSAEIARLGGANRSTSAARLGAQTTTVQIARIGGKKT
jgi:cbb3-type cytochrome oxidase cytochrome c subunit